MKQTVGGTVSPSAIVFVRDHTLDFPDGLPPPIISPAPLYNCASAIAVVHVPGVELTTSRIPDGGTTTSYVRTSGVSHSWVSGIGGVFSTGTSFKVRQKLCTDVSDWSDSELVDDEPATLPEVTFVPAQPVVGQPLVFVESIVQGSRVKLVEQPNTVLFDNVSVPYNSWSVDVTTALGGPLQAAHLVSAQQYLCGLTSDLNELPPPIACSEDTLVPMVARPHDGDDFVLVTYAVPGSTLRVFDNTSDEIGNGSADVIELSRALVAGEIIYVTAQLETCTVNRAYSLMVAA